MSRKSSMSKGTDIKYPDGFLISENNFIVSKIINQISEYICMTSKDFLKTKKI